MILEINLEDSELNPSEYPYKKLDLFNIFFFFWLGSFNRNTKFGLAI